MRFLDSDGFTLLTVLLTETQKEVKNMDKTKKKSRKIQVETIGLTLIDPKTHEIKVKELTIARKKKKRSLKC